MSKNTASVNATALPAPDRRLFLAAGPAAAVMASLRKAAADESPLSALIEKHRKALAMFTATCAREDALSKDSTSAAYKQAWEDWKHHDAAENEALGAVLSYSARDLSEARAKAEYLLNNVDFSTDAQEHVEALLQSFLA